MTTERTPFVLRLSSGDGLALDHGYPRERAREYALTLSRSVDSDTGELFGDGRRNPVPLELECYVELPGQNRVAHARRVGEIDRELVGCTALEYDELTFPLLAVRLISMSPLGTNGYKITLRFYSAQHDFTDRDGVAVPLI